MTIQIPDSTAVEHADDPRSNGLTSKNGWRGAFARIADGLATGNEQLYTHGDPNTQGTSFGKTGFDVQPRTADAVQPRESEPVESQSPAPAFPPAAEQAPDQPPADRLPDDPTVLHTR